MANVLTICKKELRSYFASPVGWVFITFFILVTNSFFFFVQDFFRQGQLSMRGYFDAIPWIFLFFVPAITMRLWSEEKKMGTMETLLTMPVKDWEAVAGKFFAAWAFLAITLLFTLTIPLTLSYLGDPDQGVVLGSYIGTMLMGAAYLAIGLYLSSITENQVVAFVLSLFVIFILLLVGIAPVYLNSLGAFAEVCDYVSLFTHFNNIKRGVIDTRDVVYYVSVIFLFLFLNTKNIEARKWR